MPRWRLPKSIIGAVAPPRGTIDRSKPTVFLHVGLPKTGTSYLQAMFARNAGPLVSQNFLYPEAESLALARRGGVTSGNGLAMAKLLGAPGLDAVSTDHVIPEVEWAWDRGQNVLYSSEHLSELDPARARDVRDAIVGLGYRLRVIAYFRSIADHALSAYSQHLKDLLTAKRFTEWVRDDYPCEVQKDILDLLLQVFDREEITALNYDHGGPDLFEHFLHHALGIDDLSAFEFNPEKVNRSLTPLEAAVMRAMAPLFSTPEQALVAAHAIVRGAPDAPAIRSIGVDAVGILRERAAGAIDFINQFLGGQPIAVVSDKLEVSAEPEADLSEMERVLGSAIAGVIAMRPDSTAE